MDESDEELIDGGHHGMDLCSLYDGAVAHSSGDGRACLETCPDSREVSCTSVCLATVAMSTPYDDTRTKIRKRVNRFTFWARIRDRGNRAGGMLVRDVLVVL